MTTRTCPQSSVTHLRRMTKVCDITLPHTKTSKINFRHVIENAVVPLNITQSVFFQSVTFSPHNTIIFCAGEVQAFHEDLTGRQYINGVYKFAVDKMNDLLFTESEFMRDFREQRRFSGKLIIEHTPPVSSLCCVQMEIFLVLTLLHQDRMWPSLQTKSK